MAGGSGAALRDTPHGGRTASDARTGRGLGLAGILGGFLGIPRGGGGGIWDAPTGGAGILVRHGIPARKVLSPKGAPQNEADSLAQALWHPTRWCHDKAGGIHDRPAPLASPRRLRTALAVNVWATLRAEGLAASANGALGYRKPGPATKG